MRALVLASLACLLALASCAAGAPCKSLGECPAGDWCVDGACTAAQAPPASPPVEVAAGDARGTAPWDDVFEDDGATLARLEMNGSGADAASRAHDAIMLDGAPVFAPTPFGAGLVGKDDLSATGFDWSAHASLLVPPYSIEMVVLPTAVDDFAKLIGGDDADDAGWYLHQGRVRAYPSGAVGPTVSPGARLYLALVVSNDAEVSVYVNGSFAGTTSSPFVSPPRAARFFVDDTGAPSGEERDESFAGVVDAVRLSSVARTADEVGSVQARLDGRF